MRWAALSLLVLGTLVYPHLLRPALYDMWFVNSLQTDLTALHAADTPHDLECLDGVDGCTTVALRMRAIMATGYLGGFLFFLNEQNPSLESMRQDFLTRLRATKPWIIVMSSQQWPAILYEGYERLSFWPEFAEYLRNNYSLQVERGLNAQHITGYRIYLRKSTQAPGK